MPWSDFCEPAFPAPSIAFGATGGVGRLSLFVMVFPKHIRWLLPPVPPARLARNREVREIVGKCPCQMVAKGSHMDQRYEARSDGADQS
jgi:hypothetical protein